MIPPCFPARPATGTVASGQDEYYKLNVGAGSAVTLSLNAAAAGGAALYVQYQSVPTTSSYSQFSFTPTSGTQTVTIPGTSAGTYYILVQGGSAAGAGTAFSLSAAVQPFAITSVGLASGGQGQVTIPITGSQFDSGTTFQLLGPGNTVINAKQTYLQDDTSTYATFDLSNASPGQYTVQATKSGNITTQLAGAFSVVPTVAANLQLNLAVPSAARANRQGTVTVTYKNTGNTDLVAPLLELTADNATLKLPSQQDFGTGDLWFLGTSPTGPAGVIRPGESGQVSIEFLTTSSLSAQAINFQVNSADATQPMDWADQEDALRLPTISTAAWPAVFANFVANVGNTVASYNAALAGRRDVPRAARRADERHLPVGRLEVEKANGSYTGDTLETVEDDSIPAPGLSLTFSREFPQSISGRYSQGIFGNGWSDNWDISASTDSAGDAIIEASGSFLFYAKNADGTYSPDVGDHSTLTFSNGAYRIVENRRNCPSVQFRRDAQLR